MKKIFQVKRFVEKWRGDSEFRNNFIENPQSTLNFHNLKLEWKDVGLFLENRDKFPQKVKEYPLIQEYIDYVSKFLLNKKLLRKSKICDDKRLKKWRNRQLIRLNYTLPKIYNKNAIQVPVAFELTDGCSGKCWFCALAKSDLKGIFYYSDKNSKIWNQIIDILHEILGEGLGASICYFGTEPFDNPDYEKFCMDLYNKTNLFPQTTTVYHLKNPERTRKLLKFSEERGNSFNRFSVTSLKMLKKIHDEFTPDELSKVVFEFRYKDALNFKFTYSGKVRNFANKKEDFLCDSSVACLTGFLINMVRGSVELVSPCVPSDKWPNGYIVFDRGYFSNAEEFKEVIEEMIDRNMGLKFEDENIVRFREDLKFEEIKDGFILSTKYMKRKYKNEPVLKSIGKMISKGNMKLKDICGSMELLSISPGYIKEFVNILYDDGVLFDEPESIMEN